MTLFPHLQQSRAAVLRGYAEDYPLQGPVGSADAVMRCDSLWDAAGNYEHIVLDGYGVLTTGAEAVPGMVEMVARLRQAGKRLSLLTNGSTAPKSGVWSKYQALGYDFSEQEIISSRDVMLAALGASPIQKVAITPSNASTDDFPCAVSVLEHGVPSQAVDAIVLSSTQQWSEADTQALVGTLRGSKPPALWCGNPDLGAPLETAVSVEPGRIALDVQQATGCEPVFFGKPFANTYAYLFEQRGITEPADCLMVGDTLHTDVLGAKNAGMAAALMLDYGYFANDLAGYHDYQKRCGIYPDYTISEQQ